MILTRSNTPLAVTDNLATDFHKSSLDVCLVVGAAIVRAAGGFLVGMHCFTLGMWYVGIAPGRK